MKSKIFAINKSGLVGVLLFIIGIVFAWQYFMHACLWWNCAPERDFRVLEMGLPSSVFPDGVQITPFTPSSEGAGEVERGSQSIFWNKGNSRAGYGINRYSTIKKANWVYELDYNNMAKGDLWVRTAELNYSSSTADQFFIACGDWAEIYHCGMLARYQEYEIYFTAPVDDQMKYSDFEKIVVYIDEQIASRLYP